MKILIVEDEKELSESIINYLGQQDYLCEKAFSFDEAILKVGVYDYDCVLLDLMLPGGSGLDILKKIRKKSPRTGIIIVSAKDSIEDKVLGLEIGADDYLSKPFHLPELRMRIFALMRRKNFSCDNIMRKGPITIDLLSKSVSVYEKMIELTKTEYELLLFFIENSSRVISKSAIAEHLSGEIADLMDNFNYVYTHIKNLKAKLADAGVDECIKTYYGTGYKWNVE
jgi:DNA-binding response OmpR family regulator